MIEQGSLVSVHYVGKLTDGEIFDSSLDVGPLEFKIGSNEIIAGFENALIGKNVGDKLSVNIQSGDAYGEYDERLIQKIDKDKTPEGVSVGDELQAVNGDDVINVSVKEVTDEYVLIDANHPLAGKELVFDIEVLEVK